MWTKLIDIYGGDDNIKRAKVESLRVQFDQIKMREDENIEKYAERINVSVSAVKSSTRKIEDVTLVRKVRITLLLIYAIKVSFIQEMRCDPNNKINLDALVGRLTTFELDNYDNYNLSSRNLESSFEAKV